MDRKYYYRILGLQEGASAGDIKKAYELRMERLRSADYADDPEYVAKKMSQAKYAYSVLMGSAAPMTKAQRKQNYECYKDDIEDNRDSDHFTEKHGHRLKKLDASVAAANAKRKLQSVFDSGESIGGAKKSGRRSDSSGGIGKMIITIICAAIPFIVGAIGMIADNTPDVEWATPEYSEELYAESNYEAVKRIMGRKSDFDFYGTRSEGKGITDEMIEWELSDDVYNQLWGLNTELAYVLDIYDFSYAVEYLTGDPDYYWENSDLINGQELIYLMGAPYFEDVAGSVNDYTGEPILDYVDYMSYLICVAENQTDEICGPEVEYYY